MTPSLSYLMKPLKQCCKVYLQRYIQVIRIELGSDLLMLNGDTALYAYLKSDLKDRHPKEFEFLLADMLNRLTIWFSPEIYEQLPILVPYAARDPDSRGNKKKGIPDQWGSPNTEGIFRDDNSLIKGLPKSLIINSPNGHMYNGKSMGKGFVAAHVWPKDRNSEQYTTRNPLTYSFVPNITWMPSHLAKLTDLQGTFAQRYIQALSTKIYGETNLSKTLLNFTDGSDAICNADPREYKEYDSLLPDRKDFNMFELNESFITRRIAKIQQVQAAISARINGQPIVGKIISKRYTSGLQVADPNAIAPLNLRLKEYIDILQVTS